MVKLLQAKAGGHLISDSVRAPDRTFINVCLVQAKQGLHSEKVTAK